MKLVVIRYVDPGYWFVNVLSSVLSANIAAAISATVRCPSSFKSSLRNIALEFFRSLLISANVNFLSLSVSKVSKVWIAISISPSSLLTSLTEQPTDADSAISITEIIKQCRIEIIIKEKITGVLN